MLKSICKQSIKSNLQSKLSKKTFFLIDQWWSPSFEIHINPNRAQTFSIKIQQNEVNLTPNDKPRTKTRTCLWRFKTSGLTPRSNSIDRTYPSSKQSTKIKTHKNPSNKTHKNPSNKNPNKTLPINKNPNFHHENINDTPKTHKTHLDLTICSGQVEGGEPPTSSGPIHHAWLFINHSLHWLNLPILGSAEQWVFIRFCAAQSLTHPPQVSVVTTSEGGGQVVPHAPPYAVAVGLKMEGEGPQK